MREGDLELSAIELDELEPRYTVGRPDGRKLDPELFSKEGVDNFLEFWEREVGDHDNVDFDYAKQVLRKERSGTEKGLEERFNLQPHSKDVLEIDSKNPVYDAVIEELVQTLYGQALNKDEGFKEDVEAFERFLKGYDPEPYREIVENSHTYTIEHLTDSGRMLEAGEASGSFIEGRARYFEEYAEDEFSMITEIRKDGDRLGYMRNFLMEDEDGNEFLAMDTIEVDHKNFDENKDAVRAAGMASIQMMYDLDADYLVGSDARVKYGVRQAYGSSEKSVTGEKLGDQSVKDYSFNTAGTDGKSAYLLMENPG
ncbi:MAG: hypothetical protein V5A72_00970 [Candidatus Nanohaloarchaea archaeon]